MHVIFIAFKDYCIGNKFKAECGTNEVVVMSHAFYGIMRLGSCIKEIGSWTVGCSENVIRRG